MDRSTAVDIWRALEEARETEVEGDPPTYDVRLDAATSTDTTFGSPREGQRFYRVRVAPARGSGGLERDRWQYVMELAVEHGTEVDVDNNALVLS